MKRYTHSILIITAGIVLFQAFSTLQVYLSNQSLLTSLEILKESGYLIVPNAIVMEGLKGFIPAFCGGVFFTLTIGAFVTLVPFAHALVCISVNKKLSTTLMYAGAALACTLVIYVNSNGINVVETLALLTVPVVVFFLTTRALGGNKSAIYHLAPHTAPLVILGLLLMLSSGGTKGKLFSDFRDNFLLSNTAGMAINNFYYTYTLYPARVFKSFEQRVLTTCFLEVKTNQQGVAKRVESRLRSRDYLVVNTKTQADFTVQINENTLRFIHNRKTVSELPVSDFISDPKTHLKRFSKQTDTYGNYRKLTGISLKTGFPLLVYLLLHYTLCTGFCFIKTKPWLPPAMASLACLVIGIICFISLGGQPHEAIPKNQLVQMTTSDKLKERVEGIKYIHANKMNISAFPGHRRMISRGTVLEKYWIARASGFSRTPENNNDIKLLLNDPHPNVVCQAFYAIGMKGDRRMINDIITRIGLSDNWYVQWYAYRALKRLGWKQKKSN